MSDGRRGFGLTFLGAAGMVTGSRTLVTAADGTLLLVDCGMFQGYKHDRLRNREPLGVAPADLAAVVLTHAHLDHTGWLPVLVREGFRGPIYATPATCDLLHLLLPDAGRIQEEDAAFANRHGTSRHRPAQALYTEEDASAALVALEPVDGPVRVGPFEVTWTGAGHLLGAASVRVAADGASVLFSGDLGRPVGLAVPTPDPPPAADVLVLESTYGDRLHDAADPALALGAAVRRVVDRGGVLLVPSFAVGRAQALLLLLHRMRRAGTIPEIPIVLDSPMAADTSSILLQNLDATGLEEAEAVAMHRGVERIRTVQESKALHGRPGPFVLISASGMLTGGRVLHHVAARAGDPRTLILLVGFQAGGTRGARLVAGERTLRIHGQDVAVRCEVQVLDGLSAHADQAELVAWASTMSPRPRRIWINHGEPAAADALRARLAQRLGVPIEVAALGRHAWVSPATIDPADPRPLVIEVLGGSTAADPIVREAMVVAGALPAVASAATVEWRVAPDAPARERLAPGAAAHGQRLTIGGEPVATVVFPGGYDTLAEVFQRLARGVPTGPPLVLVGRAFWERALPVDDLRRSGVLGPDKGPPVVRVDDPEAAWAACLGGGGAQVSGAASTA